MQVFSKPRYRADARKYKPLLHFTESLNRDDIETFCLSVADEHNCKPLTSYLHPELRYTLSYYHN